MTLDSRLNTKNNTSNITREIPGLECQEHNAEPLPAIPQKAIFLDRDGTLVKDVPYCRRPEDLEFLPTVLDGLKELSKTDYKIIIITNQSGIARGYFTEDMLGKIHEKLLTDIRREGGRIDAVYYCPHHPDDKCSCRKPETGLLEKAAREWNINLSESYFIGDKFLDVEAANKACCKAILVPSEAPEIGELQGKNGFKGKIDFMCSDFACAVKWMLIKIKCQVRN